MDIKTFDDSTKITDPMVVKQREGIEKMRSALLAGSEDSTITAKSTMNSIAVLQLYHQVVRIIRYLDLMEKLEAKLYESIEFQIDSADYTSDATWPMLLGIQSNLQSAMDKSHKLMQNTLSIRDELISMDMCEEVSQDQTLPGVMGPETRDRLRTNAQALLAELSSGGGSDD